MENNPHPEFILIPLDDTKLLAGGIVSLVARGRMVSLIVIQSDFQREIEQAAFGTGVLVDQNDFSDDKMLQGPYLSSSLIHSALPY